MFHITLVCDDCGAELDLIDHETVTEARHEAQREHRWQRVVYDFGRGEVTELRCPMCWVVPIGRTREDQIITREPAIDYA